MYPKDMLEYVMYFSSSSASLVNRLYYNKEDDPDLVHLKKYMVSTMSGHLQENHEEEWQYKRLEVDHAGEGHHHYRVKRTAEGVKYTRNKEVLSEMPHIHQKEFKMDSNGIVTSITSNENLVLFEDDGQSTEHGPSGSSRTGQRLENKVNIRLLNKHKVTHVREVPDSELQQLINDTVMLDLNGEQDRQYTLKEAQAAVKQGLKCARKYGTGNNKRSECVMQMRTVLSGLTSSDLVKLTDSFFKLACITRNSEICDHDRKLMIDIMARLGCPTSQTILLKHVFKDNDEQEVQRCLFHFSVLQKPISQTVDAVADLCFGKDMQHHGILKLSGNQKRACLTLGSMLRRYSKENPQRSSELLHHLHTWLETDQHIEEQYHSQILRDYDNHEENAGRLQFIHSKTVLLHSLGNAAQPQSRQYIAAYAEPNSGHSDTRHTAMKALRHYDCEESATLLLNVSLNDNDMAVKSTAYGIYKEHPRAGELSHVDENLLLSKNSSSESHFREKRSKVCNLIEKLTLDFRLDIPGFDWSKKVGNDFIGASFGAKSVNYGHVHMSPVAMFFELSIENRAWIDSWVKLFKRTTFDIMNAEICFERAYRMYNISNMLDYNIRDILSEFEAFNDMYTEVVEPMAESVNEYYQLLGTWQDKLENIEVGCGRRYIQQQVADGKDEIKDRIGDLKQSGIDWIEEKFGSVFEFIDKLKEFKADVINKKNEVVETVKEWKENTIDTIHELYQEALDIVQTDVNEFLQECGVSFDLEILDECLTMVTVVDVIIDPHEAGREIVQCLKIKVKEANVTDFGLMGQMNRLLRNVRLLQERFYNISRKVDTLKRVLESTNGGGWREDVQRLVERQQGFVDDMATAMLDFVNGNMDDMGMNLQYVVNDMDQAARFMDNALRVVKQAPVGAIIDIDRGTTKINIAQILYSRLQEKFIEKGSELQGKVGSWMEGGVDHDNLMRSLEQVLQQLDHVKEKHSISAFRGSVGTVTSPREKLMKRLQEMESVDTISHLLEDIVADLKSIRYLSDGYRDSFVQVNNGMNRASESYEALKRGAEASKELIQKIFGIRFHPLFPKQVKTDCDDDCGGCGIYPNIMRGRKGAQFLAEIEHPIVAPLDSKVVNISSDEVILYPLSTDMNDYEIVISFIKPAQEVLDEPDGWFADAGMVIGHAMQSPCQPNFIHVSVRKFNSSNISDPDGKRLLNPRVQKDDDTCGSTPDAGDYVPVEDFSENEEPNPRYLEGCSKVEFKHIFEYFDTDALAEKLENFKTHVQEVIEDVADYINETVQGIADIPEVKVDDMEAMKEELKGACMTFSKDIFEIVTQPRKNVTYGYDEFGNRVKNISFNLPPVIPVITDFINTMNFTVEEFGEFLLDAGLDDLYDKLMETAEEMALTLDSSMCEMLSKVKPAKLRYEILKESGVLDGAKEYLKAQLQELKMKGCSNFVSALNKGEHHLCEVEDTSDCQSVQCVTSNKFDNKVLELSLGLAFDPCSSSMQIQVEDKLVTVEYSGGEEVTLKIPVTQIDHVNISAHIEVEFTSKHAIADISIHACHLHLPVCFGSTPIFSDLKFDLDYNNRKRTCVKLNSESDSCSSSKYKRQAKKKTIEEVKKWRMDELLYSMDRFNVSRKEINNMVETARVSVLTQLSSLTSLRSSIIGKEIFQLPDLGSIDVIEKGPFDIPFFNMSIPIPGPIKLTVRAGGAIKLGVNLGMTVLNSNVSVTPYGTISSYAEADGKMTVVITAIGLIMRGTLLETIFYLTVEIKWPEYPITINFKMGVNLIPVGVEFKGYFKILFIRVEFRIFQWKAPMLEGPAYTKTWLIHDKSAPEYEWPNNTCRVEQVVGRHWSDPAFYIEAPFYDPQSVLVIQYAVGTYEDGTDVQDWQDMGGVSQIVPVQLKVTGIPLHFTIRASNTCNLTSIVNCILDTYDVTPATGRFEATHIYTSHPEKLAGTLMVIEDSPLTEEQYVGVGVGEGFIGDQVVEWYLFNFQRDVINKDGEGELANYSPPRQGRLTSTPIRSMSTKLDTDCATECMNMGDSCVSFDYDYGSDKCDLQWTIEGKAAELVPSGAYHNFEKLGAGYTAYFKYEGLNLIHGETYYLNSRITNVKGYESYITSYGIIYDSTPPEPGPIGDAKNDTMTHENCSAAITHGERCIEVTPNKNHRFIIDGDGAATVFNGNFPKSDLLYTISNHYMTANWDGFHDDETDIWGYTWAVGTTICGDEIQEWDDPHSHLADKSYWTHQGLSSDLMLEDGQYYVSVQALNSIIYGGALVTTVCHSIPITVDTSPPVLDYVEDVYYDEDFDLLAVYYKASDPESGIKNTDIGLGETKHDVFIRPYSRHDPLHEGYEMISVDGVDLPAGVAVWVRVRVVNNVEMVTADHASQPLMMDPSPPEIGSILDGDEALVDLKYQPYNDKICVQWYDWFDPESGIDRFLWGIGSSPNTTDIMPFREYDRYVTSACTEPEQLKLNQSATYYNIIKAYNSAVNSRASQASSDGITVDITEPLAGWVQDGDDPAEDIMYSSHAASVYANWDEFRDEESDIHEYVVTVSVSDEPKEVFVKNGDENELEDHTLHFQHSEYVQITVESINGAKLKNESKSTGYVIDLTPPEIMFLRDHPYGLRYQVSDSEIYAHWLFEDAESNIKEYWLRVIEQKSKSNFHLWPLDANYEVIQPDGTNEVKMTIPDLTLKNGLRYIVEVTAVNNAKLANKQESMGVIVDTTPPIISKVYVGSFGANENVNDEDEIIHEDHHGIHASWVGYDHESGIKSFMVAVGTEPGDDSVTGGFRPFGKATDGYVDSIELNVTAETGTLYYISIYAINGAGERCDYLQSKPIHVYGENTPGIIYDGRDVYIDADYGTDTTTVGISFQGFDSPACGIRSYEWALGSEPGYSDVMQYTSYGMVMLNETHGIAEIHLPLKHGDIIYASVRAHTGNKCTEAIIHSCSNGILIDTASPTVSFITLGVPRNETDIEPIDQFEAVYQEEYTSIALEWNSTDDTSGLLNDTWMAGSLPLIDDKYLQTETEDTQIPIRSVSMSPGDTAYFTVIARDLAGNIKEGVSPPITIDITDPVVEGFRCTHFLSIIKTEVECEWELVLDNESPIDKLQLSVGRQQVTDDILQTSVLPHGYYSWKHSLHQAIHGNNELKKVVVTLQVSNKAGLSTYVFSDVVIDRTLPEVGESYISTPVTPGEIKVPKMCQQSLTTLEVSWEEFTDRESGIENYEIAVGSQEGYSDISAYRNVGNTRTVFLDGLDLVPGTQVYSSVRAINKGRLVSDISVSTVYISPDPKVEVWDGLNEEKDIDFQNDLSTLSGQVKLSQHCPIVDATWTAYDILGNNVVNETQFFKERFANDELELENFRTYYVIVELIDGINRTLKAKSDGVMTVIQPPKPGEVRDGPYYGEDRNYQESTTELSVNWDPFGDDSDPLQRIIKYEVAIGDNTAYPETRTNIHYFVDVGLNLNYTFYDMRLTPKAVQYYATVKGHSESGASIQSVSNGIRVGYSEGMEAGDVYITQFSNNATSINFYWNHFRSDFLIVHYKWGIGHAAFADDNVTLPCHDLVRLVHLWADVQPLVDVKKDTFAEKHDLHFEHNTNYYVVVIAEDQAGQCITSITQSFLADLTPPDKGSIHVEGIAKTVQYTTKENLLRVEWKDYVDAESGIKDFYIQLKREPTCSESKPETWLPLSKQLDVKDTTKHTFLGLNMHVDIPYRIVISITNRAGDTTYDYSDPIFVDTTPAIEGIIKDGLDWTHTRHFQPSTTKLEAIMALSPLGSTLDCPLVQSIMPSRQSSWTVVDDYSIVHEGPFFDTPHIDYERRNVLLDREGNAEILFHHNISTSHLEGGAVMSVPYDMIEGDYTVTLRASPGDQVIFSMTLGNGWMDEYTEFKIPIVEDPLSDEDYLKQAENAQIDFDKDLDVPSNTTEMSTTEQTTELVTEAINETAQNISGSSENYRDNFDTSAVGIHILGFPLGNMTKQWLALFWARDIEGIKTNWIYLDEDPTTTFASYQLYIEQDLTEANAGWNVYLTVNDTQKGEMNGVYLPDNYTIKMRHWTYDKYEPPLTNPFNPFHTETIISDLTIPLPKERPCQFGNAFYDMESGIEKVYVGVSNSSELEDNVVGYHLMYDICHSCELPCDHYKCNQTCKPVLNDGYQFLPIQLDNLTLSTGDFETEPEIQRRFNIFPELLEQDDSLETNETAFLPNRYHILVKIINEAGLEMISSSPGIRIDVTPPLLEHIEATDHEYDPIAPARYQRSNTTLSAWWTFKEEESFITEYQVAIGTSRNSSDISDFFTVGTSTSINIEMENELEVGNTYYITVLASNAAGLNTFASTNGITIYTKPPDTSNSTFYPMNTTEWSPEYGLRPDIYFTEFQDRLGIEVDDSFEENVNKLVWCIGESPDDTYIATCIQIEKYYDWADLQLQQDGYFYFGGIQSDIHLTWLAQKTYQINMTLDGEYVDPGRLLLEPGKCVYHHLHAQNLAHLTALVGYQKVCVKRQIDHITQVRGDFSYEIKSDDVDVKVSGNGIRGAVISGAVDGAMSTMDYGTSANITYKTYIADPHKTKELTSRVMANRLISFTNRSMVICPVTSTTLREPLQISMSFSGVKLESENESLALLFWDHGDQLWYNVEESSFNQSVIDNDNEVITGWFAGSTNKEDMDLTGKIDLKESYMIGLFIVSFFQYNSPPVLLTKRLVTKSNTDINIQLDYYDKEGDKIIFALESKPRNGNATITEEGMLTYVPNDYFFGDDSVKIELQEVDVPLGAEVHRVEETIQIHVIETQFAPFLFLELAEEVNGTKWKISSEDIMVSYEANTTVKPLGKLYICDLNPDDTLELLIQNSNSDNVTIIKHDIHPEGDTATTMSNDMKKGKYDQENVLETAVHCIENNLKSYYIEFETSSDYYGQEKLVFIGKDDHPLFSQPIVVNMYTLLSPCGQYGHCTSDHDPYCQSTDRAESFDHYQCSCDSWYRGEYCDDNYVLQVVLLILGTSGLSLFLILGLATAYKKMKINNAVVPTDFLDMEDFEAEKPESTEYESSDGSDTDGEVDNTDSVPDDTLTIDGELNDTESNTSSLFTVASASGSSGQVLDKKTERHFAKLGQEAKSNWISPGENVIVSDTAGTSQSSKGSRKKKKTKVKKLKNSKVSPRT